jgi:hypothetical protein
MREECGGRCSKLGMGVVGIGVSISLSRKAAKVRHGAALTRHTRITMK